MSGCLQTKFLFNDNLNIIIPGNDKQLQVLIVQPDGRVVYEKQATVTSNGLINLTLSNLSRGLYLVKIKGDSIDKTIKVIKQ